MIWDAAVDLEQTWIWSASGILLGVVILILFAIFEKKRQEVLELVQQLRHWEAWQANRSCGTGAPGPPRGARQGNVWPPKFLPAAA